MDELTRNEPVIKFEKTIAEFFGAPYGVATDCCTNALELCFRLWKENKSDHRVELVNVPIYTYHSIPIMLDKIGIDWSFNEDQWEGYYHLTDNIIDAAVYWKKNGYVPGTMMCLSFQYGKHLSTDRGGMILLDSESDASKLRKMAYDGRERTDLAWWKQDISTVGYHYYMTPDKANIGLENFPKVKSKKPIRKDWDHYQPIDRYSIFKSKKILTTSKL